MLWVGRDFYWKNKKQKRKTTLKLKVNIIKERSKAINLNGA